MLKEVSVRSRKVEPPQAPCVGRPAVRAFHANGLGLDPPITHGLIAPSTALIAEAVWEIGIEQWSE